MQTSKRQLERPTGLAVVLQVLLELTREQDPQGHGALEAVRALGGLGRNDALLELLRDRTLPDGTRYAAAQALQRQFA